MPEHTERYLMPIPPTTTTPCTRSPDAQATANWSLLHVWRYNPTSSTLLGEAISETSWVAQSL